MCHHPSPLQRPSAMSLACERQAGIADALTRVGDEGYNISSLE